MKKKPRPFFLTMAILRTTACAVVLGMIALAGCGGGLGSGSHPDPPVSPTATKTTLTVTPAVVVFGGTVMLTATVMYPPAEAASGIVTFVDGTARLGSAILDPNGVGSLKVTTLAVGTHAINATFAATSTLGASTSAVFIVTVTALPVTKIDTTTTEDLSGVTKYDPDKPNSSPDCSSAELSLTRLRPQRNSHLYQVERGSALS